MLAKDAGRHRCVGLKTEQCHYNDAAVDFICYVLIQSVFCLFCPWFVHCNDIKDSAFHDMFLFYFSSISQSSICSEFEAFLIEQLSGSLKRA